MCDYCDCCDCECDGCGGGVLGYIEAIKEDFEFAMNTNNLTPDEQQVVIKIWNQTVVLYMDSLPAVTIATIETLKLR